MWRFVMAFQLMLLVAPAPSHAQALSRQKILSTTVPQKAGLVKVAFFDADSTLRVSKSGSVSANSPTDVLILPGVASQIANLARNGYFIHIVSNQGGVEAGVVTIETADLALKYTVQSIRRQNPDAIIHSYDFAERSDDFRKPRVGMAQRLERNLSQLGLKVDWKQSFMVGDSAYKKGVDVKPNGTPGTHFSNADRLFAENLKIPFIEPTDFFGWRRFGIDVFENARQVEAFLKLYGQQYSSATSARSLHFR